MRPKRSLLLAAFSAVILVGLAALGLSGALSGPQHKTLKPAMAVIHLDADHQTYTSASEADTDADAVIVGSVVAETTEPGESPGLDALGDPLPAVPHTNYMVTVIKTFKGPPAGSQVIVSLIGGTTNSEHYVLDGGAELHIGQELMFFLAGPIEGGYVPLAGGAAVASRSADGSFALPAEATGQEPVTFTEASLTSTPATGGEVVKKTGGGGVLSETTRNLHATLALGPRQTLRTLLRKGLKLGVRCSGACTVVGQASIDGATAKRVGLSRRKRAVVVASGSARKAGTLVLRFTHTARHKLSYTRKIQLTLSVVVRGSHGETADLNGRLRLSGSHATLSQG